MSFSEGDTVRIKPKDYITLDENGYCDYLFFAPVMFRYCGNIVNLKCHVDTRDATSDKVWEVTGNSWLWHEDWLININPFLSDKDFEI
jgi:hypothetical protein